MVVSLFILSSYPSLGYYPSFNLSLFLCSSYFSSLGCHHRFYLYAIWVNCVRSFAYHPRFYLSLVGCLLCFSSLWRHLSFYLGLFLVPLGSKHLDAILGSTYVHCSFLWFPTIVNYLSLFVYSFVSHFQTFGCNPRFNLCSLFVPLVFYHCELSKLISMFLWFLIIRTPS